MNKEDIIRLSKNRTSNDEYEQKSLYQGSVFAFIFTLFVGICLNVVAYLREKRSDIGICALMFTGLAGESLIEGKRSRRRGLKIFGIISAVMAAIFVLGYIAKKVGLSNEKSC